MQEHGIRTQTHAHTRTSTLRHTYSHSLFSAFSIFQARTRAVVREICIAASQRCNRRSSHKTSTLSMCYHFALDMQVIAGIQTMFNNISRNMVRDIDGGVVTTAVQTADMFART